ncbi:hypothetical protein P8815_17895 [Bacillus altitudinis]|uniref:hypothetical protein n=1 Tax=Bacillus TaxID=1386 RepID=UPI000776A5ED|nr:MULTISPECIES: hypothetical protein [Bacillus]AMM99620.1 hypothetical protein UP12_19650 [Bacillus pumilus]MEC0473612.1 hypothetical protein [Bacillus altitudinis]
MATESEITRLNKKINRLQQQAKSMEKFQRDRHRRERTRRLIEIGAMAQKHFELENNTLPEIEEILIMFSEYVRFNKPNTDNK